MDHAVVESPLGKLELVVSAHGLRSVNFVHGRGNANSSLPKAVQPIAEQLRAYFEDPAFSFSLEFDLQGTEYQKNVWRHLSEIPSGSTSTYSGFASSLGTGARAIGNACRRNPIPIIVPCHRVVSVSGPGGYAGATQGREMDVKMWLLNHERAL